MSETTGRLDAIEARAKDFTDLCAEHLRQSIRHVQRNCDIECNVHEDEATWGDCKQPERGDGGRMAAVLADIPYLLTLARKQAAALERVRELADDACAQPASELATVRGFGGLVRAALGDGETRTCHRPCDCVNAPEGSPSCRFCDYKEATT